MNIRLSNNERLYILFTAILLRFQFHGDVLRYTRDYSSREVKTTIPEDDGPQFALSACPKFWRSHLLYHFSHQLKHCRAVLCDFPSDVLDSIVSRDFLYRLEGRYDWN